MKNKLCEVGFGEEMASEGNLDTAGTGAGKATRKRKGKAAKPLPFGWRRYGISHGIVDEKDSVFYEQRDQAYEWAQKIRNHKGAGLGSNLAPSTL